MRRGRISIVIITIAILVCACAQKDFVYCDHLTDTVVTVDGTDMTFSDIAFYVVYEEYTVQKQAITYDSNDTTLYWNLHINGNFMKILAADTIINMAVHDQIYYVKSQEDGIALTEDEIAHVKETTNEYYQGLSAYQRAAVGITQTSLYDTMYKMALSEKAVAKISNTEGISDERLKVGGDLYEIELDKHTKKVKKVWEDVKIGSVTIER